jgi:natural product biosynthesis luciferase-like monooxygenase protein
MNVLGYSGLSNSYSFKQKQFPGLSAREYNIAQGFDAAAALVRQEGVLAAAAEERFTRQKATGAFPINAIRYCLKAGNLQLDEVDYVAHGFSYEPYKTAFQADEFARRQYDEVFAPEVQKRFLSEHFGALDWDKKFVPVPHHLAHAASAFYPSGFENALILISDGMGEVQSMTVATGQGSDINVITEIPAFHSLGTLYGVFTHYLGFYINSDEYKVMGLAPYGNSRRFFNEIMEFVSLRNDGTYTLPVFAHNHTREELESHAGVLKFLADKFGPAREPESEITQHHKDLAASLQSVLQTCQLHVLRHFRRQTGQKNLCLAGGVALNCSCNGLIKRSEIFERVFVQPAAGDDGTAIGAALYVQRLHEPKFKSHRISVPLWGPEFSDVEIREALRVRNDCQIIEKASFDELCKDVTDRLAKGQIVAWFQGRMEFGPRALGSRSILADPRDPTMRDRINALVKKREGFRPFAPVVAAEAAARIFEINAGEEDTYSHMLYVTHVRNEYRDKLPATTHVDGSARIQTVSEQQNPRLWQLLNEFAKHSDIPVLLNTSFNVRGQPIVCTPQEAIETYLAAKLDVLVIGNFIVTPKLVEKVVDPGPDKRHQEFQETVFRHEEFWVNRLCSLQPVALPFKRKEVRSSLETSPGNRVTKLALAGRDSIPADVISFFERSKNSGSCGEMLLTAFAALLSRLTGSNTFDLNFGDAALRNELNGLGDLFATYLPLQIEADLSTGLNPLLTCIRADLQKIRARKTYSLELPKRHPAFHNGNHADGLQLPVAVQMGAVEFRATAEESCPSGTEIMLRISGNGQECAWYYNQDVFEEEAICQLATHFINFLESIASNPDMSLATQSLLGDAERQKILLEWNDTAAEIPDASIHELFESQARKTPEAVALIFEEQQITYQELNRRADLVASKLRELGVGPDVLVGICVERSIEMMVGLLGILKAGGAYVPLDPAYPKERLAFMIEDSKPLVLVTQTGLLDLLPKTTGHVVCLDNFERFQLNSFNESSNRDAAPTELSNPESAKAPSPLRSAGALHNGAVNQESPLAYVIYTSGSTGKPKGAMITHRNVVNFFVGMDEWLKPETPGIWLAVTSISFDISVLEIFWTLTRGFKVVIQRNEAQSARTKSSSKGGATKPIDLSLFYFASDESGTDSQKYRLLLEGAKFADERGFAAIWTPERHFHAFGGLYPNPSVTSAAVAAITSRIQIRAGSVVLPLHNPIRVAEEWAVVDNLSNGRVAISFASGWQVNDFVLAPENYARRKQIMLEQIELVRKLWRGETVSFRNSNGQDVPLRILPRPIQRELPIWITASGHPDTFKLAGELGANVLTHLLGQSVAELGEKLAIYRSALKENGHTGVGHVTLMLHTFVGEDDDKVREIVRGPFTAYLRSSIDLIKNDPWAFGTFKRPANSSNEVGKPAKFSDEELDAMSKHAFGRYFETSGLFGSIERCCEMVEKLRGLGVDEIGCLIDFGVPAEQVLSSFEKLDLLRRSVQKSAGTQREDYSIPTQLERHGVTHFQCTPSLAAMLMEDPKALPALRSLKKLLLGGEALPASLVSKLNISGEILNMYGPTETTIWSTTDTVGRNADLVTIGRPIANTQIYIVDKFLQPVPVGVPGELLIGGAGVVRGYFNRPELTGEKFMVNPFANGNAGGQDARLYRTGDLVRYLPDGRIEFLGRLDHQVKLRGYRIELGEIEAVLRQRPNVKDCVAIVREDVPGDKRLVAYVVLQPGTELQATELREHVKSKLPDYMVPSAFVRLESLPLTPNGKVDRKALPVPGAMPSTEKISAEPSSALERTIAKTSAELLGVSQVGLRDNFFELGGNSLLATQLIARLREALNRDVPLSFAFEYPTVEMLAKGISAQGETKSETGSGEYEFITHVENSNRVPLSFAQQRIWFLHQLEPGSHYNDHFDLRIRGPLDPKILERAINEIVRRHDTLRCSFSEREGEAVQTIASELILPLQITDLSQMPASARESEAMRLAIEDCKKPFELERAPLFRCSLVRIAPDDHLMILTFDHIIVDGWSHGVFLTELTKLYEAFLAGRPTPLPELPIQYGDFAAWQQRWMDGEAMAGHLQYWKQQLQEAPPLLELPTDRPRLRVQSFQGARSPFTLDKKLMEDLTAVGRRENCTLFMVLMASFQTLLARRCGCDDIVVGSPIANRNRHEIEPLIGSFMNSLAFRGDLTGDPTFVELLKRTRKTALDAYAHQDLPFEKLVAEIQPTRNLGYSPVFQVMFILQNTPAPITAAGRLKFTQEDIDAGSSKLDLTLNLEETDDGCLGWMEYSTDLFDRATIEQMISQFRSLLESVVTDPSSRISELAIERVIELKVSEGANGTKGHGSKNPQADGRLLRNSLEKDLADIWSEVLGVQEIGPNDKLFDLGGHSLLITRIISRIRKRFQVDVPIHAFFDTPTVAEIAALVKSEMESGKASGTMGKEVIRRRSVLLQA